MDSYNIKDNKFVRNISPFESVYLRNDVIAFLNRWLEYYEEKLKRAQTDKEKFEYEGSVNAIRILKDELKS